MLKKIGLFLAALAVVAAVAYAQLGGPKGGIALGGSTEGAGTTNTSNIAVGDSLKTSAVRCFGASKIVWTIYAATGQDTMTIVQVSQDSTHWFRADASPLDVPLYAQSYSSSTRGITAAADSLNKGPRTLVLSVFDVNSGTPDAGILGAVIVHRYARLWVRAKYVLPLTGLKITCRVIYSPGSKESDFSEAYNDVTR